jgi:cytochrome c biogenesis protein CcmG, thiol:disulfide interchange protein DsbE
MGKYLVPLGIFAVVVAFLAVGLKLNPREVPSPLIDKPAPAFQATLLDDSSKTLSPKDLLGKVWILNVWASWCEACQSEHPVLVDFSRTTTVPIYGLDYKDQTKDALAWLGKLGNPYKASLSDPEGRIGVDYGVYGVPESFVIDKQGTIRYKQIGPITPDVLRDKIVPLLKALDA